MPTLQTASASTLTDDASLCWRMLRARDPRFDGRFFVGVSSTGIYCRPVCAARTPRAGNCRFFGSAALAERSGFRPCLRCRPELAPGCPGTDTPARLARACADLIEEGALQHEGLPGIARRLGVTDRHLRRVFGGQFGVSPIDYAQTQRLLLAKRLLTDTRLSVTDIALASGFGSLRRFNDCFVRRYRLAPSALRRQANGATVRTSPAVAPVQTAIDIDQGLMLRLAYRPPLDWNALVDFLSHRAIDGVESISQRPGRERVYRRTLRMEGSDGVTRCGWIEVVHAGRRTAAGHLLEVRIDPALVGAIPAVLARVRRAFDLACRPDEVAAALGELARGEEGVRLPGAFDGFEIAVRAILGQQVTVRQARVFAARVSERFGDAVSTPWPALRRVFPSAKRIARCDPSELGELGIIGTRARALVMLASAVDDASLRLEPGVDIEQTCSRLTDIPGIGDWTAQYIAMRALGWPDAFPAADAVIMKVLGVRTPLQARQAAAAWQPWRGYAVMHLWRKRARTPLVESPT